MISGNLINSLNPVICFLWRVTIKNKSIMRFHNSITIDTENFNTIFLLFSYFFHCLACPTTVTVHSFQWVFFIGFVIVVQFSFIS